MRLSELAEQTGAPVPTIKFYLREGLLPPGTPVSRTQADYGPSHVDRLRLVRALREVAGLSVATIGEVLAAVDDDGIPLTWLMGITQRAVAGGPSADPNVSTPRARALVTDLGWSVAEDSPLFASLDRVLVALAEQGHDTGARALRPWAQAAHRVAEQEVASIPTDRGRAEAAKAVAVGTVLYGELLAQLRLLAQESVSLARLGPGSAAKQGDVAVGEPGRANGSGRASAS